VQFFKSECHTIDHMKKQLTEALAKNDPNAFLVTHHAVAIETVELDGPVTFTKNAPNNQNPQQGQQQIHGGNS
jgi:hypothetical protein